MSTGSIKYGNGSWFFVVDVPSVGGGRKQLRRRGFATKKEAAAELAVVMADVHRGSFVRPMKGTLGPYLLEQWLPARQARLRPSTYHGYEKVIRTRIVPWMGDAKLAELNAAELEAFYGRLLVEGGHAGRALSPKTVANVAGIISIALGDAVRLKLRAHNPANDARLPRRPRREMTAWSESEASAFLDSVADDRLQPLWRLLLTTGMRRGELAGLRWRDVDLVAGAVTVARTRVVADVVVDGEPKTRAGERLLAIDPVTVSALQAWRRRQAEERLRLGAGWPTHDLVFVDEIWVAPERRSRGVGAALIEHGIATTKGAVAFELEVSPGNRARALYERLGFRPLRNASLRRMLTP